jgi:hypothetical protein
MTWLTARASTFMLTGQNMRVSGMRTSSTVRVRNAGLMVPSTAESTREGGSMAGGNWSSLRAVITRAHSLTMKYLEKAITTGQMGNYTRVNGRQIR